MALSDTSNICFYGSVDGLCPGRSFVLRGIYAQGVVQKVALSGF